MTTLLNKFQDVTKRLQQLNVWRPNERDPFFELDRWRTEAHTTIEQIYNQKKLQMEQLMEKHEREFMRQLSRQRYLLNNVRKRLLSYNETNTINRTENEYSVLQDLQKIENDINTKLGRAEIAVEVAPINFEDSVIVGLKKYLSNTSSMYSVELSTRNEMKKPIRRTNDEPKRVYEKWLEIKKQEDTILARRELQLAKQNEQLLKQKLLDRQNLNDRSFDEWLTKKRRQSASKKKNISLNTSVMTQESNET